MTLRRESFLDNENGIFEIIKSNLLVIPDLVGNPYKKRHPLALRDPSERWEFLSIPLQF